MVDVESRAAMRRPRPLAVATLVELRRLERNLRRTPAEMQDQQAARLRGILRLARGAPFWQDRLARPWPIAAVTKQEMRDAGDADLLTATPPPGTRTVRTSGSTGEPMRVVYPPGGAWFQGLLFLRTQHQRGVRALDRRGRVTVLAESRRRAGALHALRRRLEVDVPAHASPDELLQRLRETRPRILAGHSQVLVEAGEALAGRYTPRGVQTHGDTLTAETRAELRALFGVEPLDSYGTSECGVVAWQCREGDLYHINHEAVVVEIVDDDDRPVAPGDEGDLVLTSLWNPLMPFLRYRIGDAAAMATRPCRCGSPLPALAHVTGRTYDWVVDARGRRVAPHRLLLSAHLGVDALTRLKRYSVRQDVTRRVQVDVVASAGGLTVEDRAALAASYRSVLGDVPVDVRIVERLDTVPGRKFETIRSDATATA